MNVTREELVYLIQIPADLLFCINFQFYISDLENVGSRNTVEHCSFTHSKTLFLAVVLDFVLLALIKI
jgi:hypothetical protein